MLRLARVVKGVAVGTALADIRKLRAPIVLCERTLASGTWKEMLEQARQLPDPPLVIVTSRVADEALWAEALNLGAYDVLAKPFDASEVERTLSMAWLHWSSRKSPGRARAAVA